MIDRVPCVMALLLNQQHQILMHQRDDRPDIAYPNHWATIGGHVESIETPEAAIHRELREELNLDVPLALWKIYDYAWSSEVVIIQHVYVGIIDRPLSSLMLTEGQALRFVGQQELEDLPIGFGFAEVCAEFFGLLETTGSFSALFTSLSSSGWPATNAPENVPVSELSDRLRSNTRMQSDAATRPQDRADFDTQILPE